MAPILFCNIGWMSHYKGNAGKPDNIVGGGKWVTKNKTGHEVCNFLAGHDGRVFGHVETIRGRRDRKIRIEAIGGIGDFVNGVDVVWTATNPDEGGRRIVGWYRDATVFRERQDFDNFPTRQHKRDKLRNYRICARLKNVRCLAIEERTLIMGRGKGWMGQTSWWSPSENDCAPEVRRFLKKVQALLNGYSTRGIKAPSSVTQGSSSPGAAEDPYIRYVETYETQISPRHAALQKKFERFLANCGATQVRPNVARVDLRYCAPDKQTVFAEIKPCERTNARYAIRSAMGQLLDYRQHVEERVALLVVLEIEPKEDDRRLATSNGFGIAFPAKGKFSVIWPLRRSRDNPTHLRPAAG